MARSLVTLTLGVLALIHPGNLLAQEPPKLGPLRDAGQSAQPSPEFDRYLVTRDGLDVPVFAGSFAARLAALDAAPAPLRLRGAREIEIYRKYAPSAPMILVGDDGIGSGAVIALRPDIKPDTKVAVMLTNAHVVGDATVVGVVFKPQREDGRPTDADILHGKVVKLDRRRDLALVEVASAPGGLVPFELAQKSEVQVGADVHAIGHPHGRDWTYTKGLVSQIRPQYEWKTDRGSQHLADVVQTQTPIDPGNSGGPLIGDSGRLVGINSFKTRGSEALNFAVSAGEVARFLTAAERGEFAVVAKPKAKPCEPRMTFEGRDKRDDGLIRNYDFDCKGSANASLFIPDNKKEPTSFIIDENRDGKPDSWILDHDHDGKWDISFWDTDYDGKIDLVGRHPDGALKPTRFEKYTGKQ